MQAGNKTNKQTYSYLTVKAALWVYHIQLCPIIWRRKTLNVCPCPLVFPSAIFSWTNRSPPPQPQTREVGLWWHLKWGFINTVLENTTTMSDLTWLQHEKSWLVETDCSHDWFHLFPKVPCCCKIWGQWKGIGARLIHQDRLSHEQ